MKKQLFLLFTLLLTESIIILAGEHPEAHFGKYGIKHFNTLVEYQQYIGQTVKYVPKDEFNGDPIDEKFFIKKGGSYDKEYTITEISGTDERMTFVLKEIDGDNIIKMIINNQDEEKDKGEFTYCITENYSIPLILIDILNADTKDYIGKKLPANVNDSLQVEVQRIVFASFADAKKNEYPKPIVIIKDKSTGQLVFTTPEDIGLIGKKFTNSRFKASYNIIKISYNEKNKKTHCTVMNSVDGKLKNVPFDTADISCFDGDDDKKFVANLIKVEKPSNTFIKEGIMSSDKDGGITISKYVDNIIDITIGAGEKRFYFTIKNISENTIKVVWNDAVFVDVDGSSSKIMHYGIKYSKREEDQPASTIIRGAKLEDIAAPINKVYYDDTIDWQSRPLLENAQKNKAEQTVKLMLPIQIKDVENEYIFEFEIQEEYCHPEYMAEY